MRLFRNVSIRQRLIRISLFTAGFALILSALILTINEVMVFKQAILSELTAQAEIIGSNCTAALTFNDEKAASETLSALRANKNIEFALIYNNDGSLFADYSSNGGKPDPSHRLAGEGYRFALNHLEVYDYIVLDHNVVGAIYLCSNLKALHADLFRLALVFIAVVLLSLIVVYLLSSRLQRAITGPIADLVGTMSNISEGKDYSVRAAVYSQDELGVLAEGFNAMLIQIQTRDAELEAYRKNLEELVDNRTEQLKSANAQLQGELRERRRVEDNLRESEAFIKTVMDNLPIGIAVNSVDPSVVFHYMNDNFPKYYRTTREALAVPDGFWAAVYEDPEFRNEIMKRVSADYASGDPKRLHWHDIPISRQGEETTYIEAMSTPLPDQSWMISTVWDVTERKRAGEELNKSEKFIEDILASVDEAFVVLDREYRILTANKSYCEQVGKTLAEVIGKHCYEISHHTTRPCDETECVCGCKHTFATGEPVSTVHTHADAKGKPRQVEVRTYAMKDDAGEVISVIEVINDITEKTLLEGQLRQAQKMEAIGTLAGGIAHDFNNILTAIIGFGEIVMEQLPPGPLQEEQLHVLQAGARARDLVKQILTFSRRSEQQTQPMLVQFIIKEALKLLRASIPTSIEIRENIDVDCGAVLADPGQIHQVVMNLCANASQAMRETGGVLSVSLKGVVVSAEGAELTVNLHPGPYVLLEVADTGCGMERGVRERIFEPYFTTKRMGEGTGLGLSLVHGIVTGLGGGINVYSEPGLGTTFKVYLPLIAGETPGEVVVKSEVAPGGDESLLVVDDEESITRLERKVLEMLGYRVTAFTDSEMALQAFRADPYGFDLLLTDMTMPRLNGDGLAREILAIRPELPIVLCTGFSELIDSERSKALGIREFLQKPVEKADLAQAVRRALDGE